MNSFEEEYPEFHKSGNGNYFTTKEEIRKCFLSKQRVAEAIDKFVKHHLEDEGYYTECDRKNGFSCRFCNRLEKMKSDLGIGTRSRE